VGDTALVNLGDSSDLVWENYPDKGILSQRKIALASWGQDGSQIEPIFSCNKFVKNITIFLGEVRGKTKK
jgi:hypothetical protein